jgi:hypothetical protein
MTSRSKRVHVVKSHFQQSPFIIKKELEQDTDDFDDFDDFMLRFLSAIKETASV